MKTVQVNARAVRTGDDVVVVFTGNACGEPIGELYGLGQLKMPAEVWEFFKAALMMLHRSQTEDYFFETGLRYEQPKDGREYPEQHVLELDSWLFNEPPAVGKVALKHPEEPEIVTATKGDKSEAEIDWAAKGNRHDAMKDFECEDLQVMEYEEGELRFIAHGSSGAYLSPASVSALLRWLFDRAHPAQEPVSRRDVTRGVDGPPTATEAAAEPQGWQQTKHLAERLNKSVGHAEFLLGRYELTLMSHGCVVFDRNKNCYVPDRERLMEVLQKQADEEASL